MEIDNTSNSDHVRELQEAGVNIAVTDWQPDTSLVPTTSQDPHAARATEAADLLRQIEFYFSEENLPHDAHILGLLEQGNGTVSLSEISGFRKMRKFKPKTWVRDVVRRSTVLHLSEDGKRLRRRYPLITTPDVVPRVNHTQPKKVVSAETPWLTKGMLEPTGFEECATDGPITPEVYARNREDFDPDQAFTVRIETAIMRYCARRKMHQEVKAIFEKFLIFSGFRGGQRQFVGGIDGKALEDHNKKELAEATAQHAISDEVLDGLEDGTWVVDFEDVAKGFLSSQLQCHFAWYDTDCVKRATNVLRNFYNYLLLHDVCPEYAEDICAARKVCDLAEVELPKLREVDRHLPGGFNIACSMLFGGHHSSANARGSWAQGQECGDWSDEEALLVLKTGVFAYGSDEAVSAIETTQGPNLPYKVVWEEKLGFEIVAIEQASEDARKMYDNSKFEGTIVKPLGKIRCREWQIPHAAPRDLIKPLTNGVHKDADDEYEFLMEEDILQYCYPGCKFEATVKQLDIGIMWIDFHEASYASFFTWLVNEEIRAWKEPGPPKLWMVRASQKSNGEVVDGNPLDVAAEEEPGPTEDPDEDLSD